MDSGINEVLNIFTWWIIIFVVILCKALRERNKNN